LKPHAASGRRALHFFSGLCGGRLLYTDPFNIFHPSEREGESLRLIGCLLLVSGFLVVVAALVLLPRFGLRLAFTVAGLGVEVLGIGLLTQGYKPAQKEQR
jgi:hypothetical protein